MSIDNLTLAHFRHFSSLFTNLPAYKALYLPAYKAADIYVPIRHYICRESSTNQLLFMQNKPNFLKSQMNVNILVTMDYENICDWTIGQNKPNQTQSKLVLSAACPEHGRMGQFVWIPAGVYPAQSLPHTSMRGCGAGMTMLEDNE